MKVKKIIKTGGPFIFGFFFISAVLIVSYCFVTSVQNIEIGVQQYQEIGTWKQLCETKIDSKPHAEALTIIENISVDNRITLHEYLKISLHMIQMTNKCLKEKALEKIKGKKE